MTPPNDSKTADVGVPDWELSIERHSAIDHHTEWTQIDQAHYDDETDDLVATVVTAVADAKGVDPLNPNAMRPLYEVIDLAAIEAAFFGRPTYDAHDGGFITFEYVGYKIAIRSDGWIFIYEPDGDAA